MKDDEVEDQEKCLTHNHSLVNGHQEDDEEEEEREEDKHEEEIERKEEVGFTLAYNEIDDINSAISIRAQSSG